MDTPSSLTFDDVEFGNAGEVDTQGSGWFIGFSEWAKTPQGARLRHMPVDLAATGLCVKWFLHSVGNPNGEPKPRSEGRTVSMLVGEPGEFRIEFSRSASFESGQTRTHVLRQSGDFAIWGPAIFHRAFCVQPACILTIRWLPHGTQ